MKLSEELFYFAAGIREEDILVIGYETLEEMGYKAEALEAVAEAAKSAESQKLVADPRLTDALDHLQELSDD